MKQLKRLTNKQKKELSKRISNLKGWGYAGVYEDDLGRKKDVYKKIENEKIVDETFIYLERRTWKY